VASSRPQLSSGLSKGAALEFFFLAGLILINLCLYFQLHQPYRIQQFRTSRGTCLTESVFDDVRNESFFRRIAARCYYPAGMLLRRLLEESEGKLKVTFSMSGTWISQCQKYEPPLLELFQNIAANENVEVLCETSHHTLSSLFHSDQFLREIRRHRDTIREIFGKEPRFFRNTELIYSNSIGDLVANEGFSGCLVEGWEHLLETDFNPSHVFHHPRNPQFLLLPRCYRLSDDIAFRFCNRNWSEWPLTGEKFQNWVESEAHRGSSFVGLYMDFETMGEHQWRETGIFDFWEYWLRLAWNSSTVRFINPCDLLEHEVPRSPLNVPSPLSWADLERDVSAWLGNDYQVTAANEVYGFLSRNCNLHESRFYENYQRFLTSDHFYYMSTKCSSDGDVHGYFSPFSSPIEAYLEYRGAITRLENALSEKED
jgi:alpha-amylase